MISVIEHASGLCVIKPGAERLSASNAAGFKAEVLDLISKGRKKLLIDLSEVSFVDSMALGALVGIYKKAGIHGEVAVCALCDAVHHMFRVAHMDKVFKSYATEADAISAANTYHGGPAF